MSKYPTTNITYGGLEDKGLTVKVKDSSNSKLHFSIWKNDRENPTEQSEAFLDIQEKKIGETFGVQYGEKQKSFTGREGNTVTYTERTIYRIFPSTVATPVQDSQPVAKTPVGAVSSSTRPPVDAFGRRLGIQGHINALLSNPNVYPMNDWTSEKVVRVAIQIEDEAEKQLNKPVSNEPALPTIHLEEEPMDTSDIPF